jgi:hypothetical protein
MVMLVRILIIAALAIAYGVLIGYLPLPYWLHLGLGLTATLITADMIYRRLGLNRAKTRPSGPGPGDR